MCTKIFAFSLFVTSCIAAPFKNIQNSTGFQQGLCQMGGFISHYVYNGLTMKDEDFHFLQNCETKNCVGGIENMGLMYAENREEKMLILLHIRMKKDACWGFVLQVTDDLEQNSYYFFGKHVSTFTKEIYFRLGFRYNFTVVPLPTGTPLTILTKAPTACELEVLRNINERLQKKTGLFENCHPPKYSERREVAERICKLSRNARKRLRLTKHLKEENCKFVPLVGKVTIA
ncbi:uncharacterized protein LOC130655098 [Hydractinia symbiolongicarpus]|uniref:uncharacterized protein LOC130655098 n=1 Tax=Hydractinia symbiolongicarpus TaxID=13093 RepID=UPI00254E118D|nr:uncharacterized protein LOC130655098 [Hydractinia symbiolongicarpus]